MTSTRVRLFAIAAAVFISTAVRAEVRIDVSTSAPDAEGRVTVDVLIDSDGEPVGGFQNDIVFDHTVVRLDSAIDCRINPAIGTTPLGTGSGVATCEDDRTLGPCKTLHRNVVTCEGEPPPDGCPAEAPDYSRFRAIVAATAVPNDNAIPEGVAYTCTFSVVNAELLPVRLFNAGVVVADPVGERLEAGGDDGGVCVEEEDGPGCASLRAIDERCTIDFECASKNCDRCCGHQFNGICAAPRTPTPTAADTPTRTPFPTRTPSNTRPPTPTRTATSTPLPRPAGAPCSESDDCASPLACNRTEGVCCLSEVCPAHTSCTKPGFAGYCVGENARPPGPAGIAELSVSLRSGATVVSGMQNDIVFDSRIMRLDEADCDIEPAIGLFPLGQDGPSCFEDTTIGPCKNLLEAIHNPGAANSLFRAVVVGTAALNVNAIPDGPLYRCRVAVADAARLPACELSNVVVSDPVGNEVFDARIECDIELISTAPADDGTSCARPEDCRSGNCVDNVCCGTPSCGDGESCAVSGESGACALLRADGEDCDLGSDCASGNCDLGLASTVSGARGACGGARVPRQHDGECSGGAECDSGHCVDGFCCDAESCPAGQYCNSGRCTLPAEPGARCTADEQCALGLCVDGACCVTGACAEGESCGIFGLEGTCREPLRAGSPCAYDEQCPTGFCTDGACCQVDQCPAGFHCARTGNPGECVEGTFNGEPGTDGGAPSPTPLAPGEVQTPAAPTSSPTLAPTEIDVGFVGDDGCHIDTRATRPVGWWWMVVAGLVVLARSRRGCSRPTPF